MPPPPRRSGSGQVALVILAVIGAIALLFVVLFVVYLSTAGSLSTTTSSGPQSNAPLTGQPGSPDAGVPTLTVPTTTASPVAAAFGAAAPIGPGLTARAGTPTRWTPGSTAAGTEDGDRYVRVEITLTNNTDRVVNFSEQVFTNMTIDGARTTTVVEIPDTSGLRNVTTKPGGSTIIGLAWALPTTPTTIGLEIYPRDFNSSTPTASWSQRV